MTRLLAALALLTLFLLPAAAESTVPVPLSPVPFALNVPQAMAEHLSTAAPTGPFAEETIKAGATASTLLMYQPEGGEKTILLAAYWFPEAKFDAAQKPDEPPPFGKEVIREGGMVLSIAGPHDTIFEPETPDGQNVIASQSIIYEPQNYTPLNQ